MAKLWTVIRREYLERVRNKWFVIVTIFGPLLFGTIMTLPAYLSIRGMQRAQVSDVLILDATGQGLGARIAARLSAPPALPADLPPAARSAAAAVLRPTKVTVDSIAPDAIAAREERLIPRVIAKEITGYLIVDTMTLVTGEARYAGRNAGSVGEVERLEAALRSSLLQLRLARVGVAQTAADSIARIRANIDAERITERGKGGSGMASTFLGFGVAMLLYMTLILYGQAILRGVLEEKTTRVSEVIVSSVKPDTLLAGKVIGIGAVGLTQYFFWAISAFTIWTLRSKFFTMMGLPAMPAVSLPILEPTVLAALVLFFLLGYTFYASLFAAVGAMVGSQEEANQAAQPVMLLLVSAIIFAQPVMFNPTSGLAVTMSLLPFSAPVIMPLRMTATQVPVSEIVMALLGLAVACVAAIWVSARIYRIGLLMYGKKPSMKELMRWVRQA